MSSFAELTREAYTTAHEAIKALHENSARSTV